jgi:outer membrane protein OmpA-like peptidoglycan-associated protein
MSKLDHYPGYRIVVEAHVSRGDSPLADKKLSDERAEAVKRFLTWECHVPDERILAQGRGSADLPEQKPGESQTAWERRARRARVLLVGE